jgi:hypothetical protein
LIHSPAFGVAGVVIGIAGIVLSTSFYFASQENPELVYAVHPAKAAVVRAGQTSNLTVRFNDQELKGDITAAQIAFWNAGKAAIRNESMLRPLSIRTGPKNPILEANIRMTSRDILEIRLDDSRRFEGTVELHWNILEENDGGILQIVYVGNEAVAIEGHAVVEGQGNIKRIKYGDDSDILMKLEKIREKSRVYVGWISLFVGTISFIFLVYIFIKRKIRRGPGQFFIYGAVLGQSLALTIAGAYILLTRPVSPPFGF